MSQIRYYADEHVARAVIYGLRQRGIDVLSVPEAGMMGATDDAHIAYALAQRRVLLPKTQILCGLRQPVLHMQASSTLLNSPRSATSFVDWS